MCHYLIIRKLRTPDIIALALLAFVFLVDVYRAAMQSMTIDEAFTYNLYLSKPVHELLTFYDANNHVLYTVLAKVAIGMFGNAEWVVRLPSLIGALLYLTVVYRLCSMLIRSAWLRVLGIALLTLNPYVMDFQSAARGYGLGIALMFWGVYWILRSRTAAAHPKDLRRAGFAFGLAVASSLTLAFPIAAFAVVFWATNRSWRVIEELGIPMTVSAFVFLAVPLSHATRENFYVGAQTLRDTLVSLVWCSFHHHAVAPAALQTAVLEWTWLVLTAFAVVAVVVIRWAAYEVRFLAVSGVVTIIALWVAHTFAGLKYPELRTGLYLIPFVSLVVIAVVAAVPWRVAQAALAIPLVAASVLYALQWNTSLYTEWPWDENSRTVAKLMRDRQPRRVGASWQLVEALNYYRDRYRMKTLAPLTRANPDGDFDMYALLPENYNVIAKRDLRVIYRDPKSQVMVGVPAGAP